MTDNHEAMDVRLRRSAGMSEEKKIKMNNFLKTQSDWYTVCYKCGEKITGLPIDINNHIKNCNETS